MIFNIDIKLRSSRVKMQLVTLGQLEITATISHNKYLSSFFILVLVKINIIYLKYNNLIYFILFYYVVKLLN